MDGHWCIIWLSVFSCARWIQVSAYEGYSGQGLSQIPPELPLDVSVLYMGENDFTVLDDGAFSAYTSLKQLYMNDNKLYYISPTAFAETILSRLTLKNNFLTEFPDLDVIKNTLLRLRLSHNKIRYVPEALIENLSGLITLELDGNPLVMMTNFYLHLPVLSTLNLGEIDFQCCWRMVNLKSYALGVVIINEFPCYAPDELANTPWDSIQAPELEGATLCGE